MTGNRAVWKGGLSGDKSVERFDPDGSKDPKGKWKPRRSWKRWTRTKQRVGRIDFYPVIRGEGAANRTGYGNVQRGAETAGREL